MVNTLIDSINIRLNGFNVDSAKTFSNTFKEQLIFQLKRFHPDINNYRDIIIKNINLGPIQFEKGSSFNTLSTKIAVNIINSIKNQIANKSGG